METSTLLLAAALGLEERDGVLVIFRKITTLNRP